MQVVVALVVTSTQHLEVLAVQVVAVKALTRVTLLLVLMAQPTQAVAVAVLV
jgi:hypothetical protein